jgi:hypothetical protein
LFAEAEIRKTRGKATEEDSWANPGRAVEQNGDRKIRTSIGSRFAAWAYL